MFKRGSYFCGLFKKNKFYRNIKYHKKVNSIFAVMCFKLLKILKMFENQYKVINLFLCIFLFGFSHYASATHIVGGDITYRTLGNSSYEITVKIFFDCINGQPAAISQDDELYISVFNASNNTFIQDFTIRNPTKKRVRGDLYDCVVSPTNVCVVEHVYKTVRTLNPGSSGLILSWQRCCRNNTIINIVNPEATGSNLWTVIPPTSIANNSAVFKELPPIYACVNAPLKFSVEAEDIDGDSLVYEFFTPYLAVTRDQPRPAGSFQYDRPNFRQIQWRPTYNGITQMRGNPGLQLNSATGEVTITPTIVGQHVIGYAVKEYRNGVLVGTTLRDYQVNVINCQFTLLANFRTEGGDLVNNTSSFECSDTVFFKDFSFQGNEYFWDFGDLSTLADTSRERNPFYIYPGPGDYRATLRIKNDLCEDEYSLLIRIRSKQPFQLPKQTVVCEDVNVFINTSAIDATRISWSTGATTPSIVARAAGLYKVRVEYGRFCIYEDSSRVISDAVPVECQIPPDTLVCFGEDIDFILDAGVDTLQYRWSTSPNDVSRSIRVTDVGTYRVVASTKNCNKEMSMRVWRSSEVSIPDTFICNEFNILKDAKIHEESEILWNNGQTGRFGRYTETHNGKNWVRLTQRHCVVSDTFIIGNALVSVDLGKKDIIQCDSVNVIFDAGPDGTGGYYWSNNAITRAITVTQPGKYSVVVTDSNNCIATDSVTILLFQSPVISIGSDTTICVNTPIELGVPDQYATYEWNTGSTSPTISVRDENEYKLTVIDKNGCKGSDSVVVFVDPQALPNILYFPNAFTPNFDLQNDRFPFQYDILQPNFKIMIFDRWGGKVFDSAESENQMWDGMVGGQLSPPSVFLYLISYNGCDGRRRNAKGTVMLLR